MTTATMNVTATTPNAATIILEYRHHANFDSLIAVRNGKVIQTDIVNRRLFHNFASDMVDPADWTAYRPSTKQETNPDEYGTLVATYDEAGTFTIVDQELWTERRRAFAL